MSPAWLFGYFKSNEDECINIEENVLEENATVTHEEGSTSGSYETQKAGLSSVEEENSGSAFEVDADRTTLDDKIGNRPTAQGCIENKRVGDADLSIRLSGSLDDDLEVSSQG